MKYKPGRQKGPDIFFNYIFILYLMFLFIDLIESRI